MRMGEAGVRNEGLPIGGFLLRNIFAVVALAFCVFVLGAQACAQTLIHVHADRVQFFYDRFVLQADGNVHVSTNDGMTISGDTFSMDLKLNRFLVAGHVRLQNPSGEQDGAAVADFLDFDRIYLVPLVRETQFTTGEPDRWTFIKSDFAHPSKGLEMPGDTFFFPDVGREKPYIKTNSAIIGAKSFVRFAAGQFDAGEGAGVYIPVTSYYVNFSADPHMADNSLAGANYDATWEFAGNANSISALHFRYDTVNKTYLSFEQHLSSKKAYAVFSVNPMTRPSKFWDLLLSDQPSSKLQVRTFTLLHTFQYVLKNPLESQQVTTAQITHAIGRSFLLLDYQLENFSLIPPNPYAAPEHGVVPWHPMHLQIIGQTFNEPLSRYFHGGRLYGRIDYSFGYQHNSYGLQTLDDVTYTTIWQHSLGYQLSFPDFKFGGDPNIPTKYFDINASFNEERQWLSVPHYIDTATTKISLSRILDQHFLSFLDYDVQNVGDYWGARQSKEYAPFTPVIDGTPYPGFAAFKGFATTRVLSLGVNYSNGGNFTVNLLAQKHKDFPAPVPGLFPEPVLDILGSQELGEFRLGSPPYDVTGEIRARINSHTSIDISRTYFFNFGTQRWTPRFVIQVLQ